MKAIIVYYSLEGNTKLIAEKLADLIGADLLELVPKKAYPTGNVSKFFFGGKSAVMSESPELEPYNTDISEYDTVIFGTPVWASRCAPPIRSFLENNSISGKRAAAFACASGKSAGRAFNQIEELSQCKLAATELFIDPKRGRDSSIEEKLAELKKKLVM